MYCKPWDVISISQELQMDIVEIPEKKIGTITKFIYLKINKLVEYAFIK